MFVTKELNDFFRSVTGVDFESTLLSVIAEMPEQEIAVIDAQILGAAREFGVRIP